MENDLILKRLATQVRTWLVTGGAGFIGSNLVETLLRANQRVTVLDNFSSGHARNLEAVKAAVPSAKLNLKLIDGDITKLDDCRRAVADADIVLHQAAIGSVPFSIEAPLAVHDTNVSGFLNMLVASKDKGVDAFVYASSSAVYGDEESTLKVEGSVGRPLSPYAATKQMNESYAGLFFRTYGLRTVGLRYFNVFGPRQDPNGAYAAVVPKWIKSMLTGAPVEIFGDGKTSRDFCYVSNVVQGNLMAALTDRDSVWGEVYNIACEERTDLNELFHLLRDRLSVSYPQLKDIEPVYKDFRRGDIQHSSASISRARRELGYKPTHSITAGLDDALNWYIQDSQGAN